MPIRARLALASVAILAGLTSVSLAQPAAKPGKKTEARFAGGYRPDACRYPKPAREKQLSGCCQMDRGMRGEFERLDKEKASPSVRRKALNAKYGSKSK